MAYLTSAELDRLERLHQAGCSAPWRWGEAGIGPQIEGEVEYPEFSPVLVALGCGCGKAGKGCMPNLHDDTMRHCPLQPSRDDRELIIAARNALPALLAEVRAWRRKARKAIKNPPG